MNSDSKQLAIECIKQAVQQDTEENYDKAYPLYMSALHHFKTYLEYEKTPKIHEAISKKYTEYLRRAEEIKAALDRGWTPLNHCKTKMLREQAIEYANQQAVQEDNSGNYPKALPLYMSAIEYFNLLLRFEKIPKSHEDITQKVTEYLDRAENIRAVLEGGRWKAPAKPGDLEYIKSQSFREQAVKYVTQAVQEDNEGNYYKAFSLYMNALEYFKTYFKYETNPKMHEAVTQKFTEYLRRAEELKAVLDEGGSSGPGSKPNDGEGSVGGGGDDGPEENSELKAGLNAAIVIHR